MPRLKKAVEHYLALKQISRERAPDLLEFYEGRERRRWRYDRVTKENFLRLLYRIIWTSGFKAEIVFAKENEYFDVVQSTLYRRGMFSLSGRDRFLREVAPVLGAHEHNRKNRAFADVVAIVEKHGWNSFRGTFLAPGPCVEDRLLELPMIGPKTVKLFLNQLGIQDTAKDDIWVTRFATLHGFDDPLEAVRRVAQEVGDDQTTVDAVLFWAGRVFSLRVAESQPA